MEAMRSKIVDEVKGQVCVTYLSLKNLSVFKNSISNSLKRYKAVFDILLENIFSLPLYLFTK